MLLLLAARSQGRREAAAQERPASSSAACGCLFGECVGFPLSSAPGPYGPNGAAYAASGLLWCRLESSLAYLSCFATPTVPRYPS